jgi:hypothetical protein
MRHSQRIKFIVVFILFFLVMILFTLSGKNKVDWSYSFSKNDKIPYGAYILYDLLPDIFPGAGIRMIQKPLYSVFQEQDTLNSNYIILNKTFDPDPLSMKSLLQFVARGNTLFLAAEQFSRQFSDTLGFRKEIIFHRILCIDSGQETVCLSSTNMTVFPARYWLSPEPKNLILSK